MALLHVITDPELARGRTHAEIVAAAIAGGCDVVQFRDKRLAHAELAGAARPLRELTRAAGRTFVINDHLDVARAVGADGLHVGPDDLPAASARRLWPPPAILGVSARTPELARRAEREGADYLGVGPVFGTRTKRDAPAAIGIRGLRLVVEAVRIPVIAIGGIDAGNAPEAIRAGAAGVAVIASVVGAEDVEAAARSIREALDRAAREADRPAGPAGRGGAFRGPLLG
jgi:thiamine-phosphate pyrophosphorylase